MNCENCGASLPENAGACPSCGGRDAAGEPAPDRRGRRGFSPRIKEPAFAPYIGKLPRRTAPLSVVLAVASVAGFYAAGEFGSALKNPEALDIGIGVGMMFLLVALYQSIGARNSKTWDGTVEDKVIRKKTERRHQGGEDVRYEQYLEYAVVIRSDRGKKIVARWKDDDTLYNYFTVGDRVRHHAGLNSYEKQDKTGDRTIPCAACGTLCDIRKDRCHKCGCPLLN